MSRVFSVLFACASLSVVGLSAAFGGCSSDPPPNLFGDGGGPDVSTGILEAGNPEATANEAGNGCLPGACGASCAAKCNIGDMCVVNDDCKTAHCGVAGLCDVSSCADGVKNGDESDVDCGGSCSNRCEPGQTCVDPKGSDCSSGVCTNKICAAPSCTDMVKNGAESDIDCGGTCPKCATGKFCKGPNDCTSALCSGVCVQCLKGTDCADRICTNNACITPSAVPPSCNGLAANCGAAGNDDCCTSLPVTGGTFNRSFDGQAFNDATNPATVGNFKLDKYEVTVGRFRKFVAAYPGNRPTATSGANANNPADQGWDMTWTQNNLPTTAALLTGSFTPAVCQQTPTWTDMPGANENKPIDCLTWYVAYAFCIWDQGRLPTEAEWNYAAAGGNQQRVYPWANGTAVGNTVAVFGQTEYANVGSLPAGAGAFGQLDMAGNVWEWTLDYYPPTVPPAVPVYPKPCDNCANFAVSTTRTIRGGIQNPQGGDVAPPGVPNVLMNGNRGSVDPANQAYDDGVRCARR